MASVVALRASGGAVSTLTNPDGTYQIQGIPPGQYLHAHRCRLRPTSFSGGSRWQRHPPSGPFTTVFYPSTINPLQALPITVTAGGSVELQELCRATARWSNDQRREHIQLFRQQRGSYGVSGHTSGAGTFVAQGTG
jgi:hypothetical protein